MRKKVLFFADGLYGGGAEKVLQTLLQHIDKDKFEITLYSMKQEALNDLYPQDINYHYVFSSCSESASVWKKLRVRCLNKVKLVVYYHLSPTWFYRLFIKGKYDTEVAFIEGYATRIVSGSTNLQSKKIAWVHTNLENNHWTGIAFRSKKEEMDAYLCFDKVVGVSHSVVDGLRKLFPGCKNYLCVYNPVNKDLVCSLSKQGSYRRKNTINFVSCGRLVPQKGYMRLLNVILQIIKDGYNFHLNIIGEGPERPNLELYINENKLNEYVTLSGYQENPYIIMGDSDCFICSSIAEGFSLVILESMILGIPVISTNCSGPNELLGNSEYGLLVENTNEGLYEGIKKILADNNILDKLKNKSKLRAQDFDMDETILNIEGIL